MSRLITYYKYLTISKPISKSHNLIKLVRRLCINFKIIHRLALHTDKKDNVLIALEKYNILNIK